MNIEQRYFWKAWYSNTTLSEYNGVVEAPFSLIDRMKLVQFGIEGNGDVYKYNVSGGEFLIDGNVYTFGYCDTILNQKSIEYRNIVQFKDAEASIGLYGRPFSRILKHTFGWADKIGDLEVRVLYEIPVRGVPCFIVEVTSPIDKIGKFTVYKNEIKYLAIHASVKASIPGKARVVV